MATGNALPSAATATPMNAFCFIFALTISFPKYGRREKVTIRVCHSEQRLAKALIFLSM
jgi:hypothetical protein